MNRKERLHPKRVVEIEKLSKPVSGKRTHADLTVVVALSDDNVVTIGIEELTTDDTVLALGIHDASVLDVHDAVGDVGAWGVQVLIGLRSAISKFNFI